MEEQFTFEFIEGARVDQLILPHYNNGLEYRAARPLIRWLIDNSEQSPDSVITAELEKGWYFLAAIGEKLVESGYWYEGVLTSIHIHLAKRFQLGDAEGALLQHGFLDVYVGEEEVEKDPLLREEEVVFPHRSGKRRIVGAQKTEYLDKWLSSRQIELLKEANVTLYYAVELVQMRRYLEALLRENGGTVLEDVAVERLVENELGKRMGTASSTERRTKEYLEGVRAALSEEKGYVLGCRLKGKEVALDLRRLATDGAYMGFTKEGLPQLIRHYALPPGKRKFVRGKVGPMQKEYFRVSRIPRLLNAV